MGGDGMADARRCSGLADGSERGLSRYRGLDLTCFAARSNDAFSSAKMHRYTYNNNNQKRIRFNHTGSSSVHIIIRKLKIKFHVTII